MFVIYYIKIVYHKCVIFIYNNSDLSDLECTRKLITFNFTKINNCYTSYYVILLLIYTLTRVDDLVLAPLLLPESKSTEYYFFKTVNLYYVA